MYLKISLISLVSAIVFAVVSIDLVNAATQTLEFSELTTHPQALSQSTDFGKTIHKLKAFNGKLYAGFGDYGANTGPISINPFDINSKTFDGEVLSLPSESIGNWRIINDKIYTTTIDPTCAGTCMAGFAVGDSDHNWDLQTPINAEHVYDIATLTGTDLWLFGSAGGSTATAWRSIDGGTNWNIVQTHQNVIGSTIERYYWGVPLAGTMYTQSNLFGYSNPIQQFDGTNWIYGSTDEICAIGDAAGGPNPVVFNDNIVCPVDNSGTRLSVFDGGSNKYKINIFEDDLDCSNGCYGPEIRDLSVVDDTLYVLSIVTEGVSEPQATIFKTPDLISWGRLGGLPGDSHSFAINSDNGEVYVGTEGGGIYVAQLFQPEINESNIDDDSQGYQLSNSKNSSDKLANTGLDQKAVIMTALMLLVLSLIVRRAGLRLRA